MIQITGDPSGEVEETGGPGGTGEPVEIARAGEILPASSENGL
jgi:hypothetical protein